MLYRECLPSDGQTLGLKKVFSGAALEELAGNLDGQNRARVSAESLAGIIRAAQVLDQKDFKNELFFQCSGFQDLPCCCLAHSHCPHAHCVTTSGSLFGFAHSDHQSPPLPPSPAMMFILLSALPLLVTELCMLAVSGCCVSKISPSACGVLVGLYPSAHIKEHLWPDSRCGLQEAGQVSGRVLCAAVLHLLDRRCWPYTALCHLPAFHAVVPWEIHAYPLGLHPADALDPDSHPQPDESAADEAPDEGLWAEASSRRAGFDADACARCQDIKVGLQGGAWSVKRRGTAVSEVRADVRPNARTHAYCMATCLPKSATFELSKSGDGRAVGAPHGLAACWWACGIQPHRLLSVSHPLLWLLAEVADPEAQLTKAQAKRLRGIMDLVSKS